MDSIGPELLAQLVGRYQPALVLYARQWCDCADDVVQEAFLQLVQQRHAPDRPVAWLYRVVRNRAISAGRAARRREKHEAAAAERKNAWFLPATESSLSAAAMQEALASLPSDQKEVIIARLWGGLSFDEIAEVTGLSRSTAHRIYGAGLAALRERLETDTCCPKTEKR